MPRESNTRKGADKLFAEQDGLRLKSNVTGVFHAQRIEGGPTFVLRTGFEGLSDKDGFRTITVTPEMVGITLAVYVAAELKGSKTPITQEQKNYIAMVINHGGIGVIARKKEDLAFLLREDLCRQFVMKYASGSRRA